MIQELITVAPLLNRRFLPPETILTFLVASSGTVTDDFSNQSPGSISYTHVVHLRGANTVSDRVAIQELAGLDDVRYPLIGIAPAVFPASIKHMNPMIATCQWDDQDGRLQIFRRPPTGFEHQSGERFYAMFMPD